LEAAASGSLEDDEVESASEVVELASFVLAETLVARDDDLAEHDVIVKRTTADRAQADDVRTQLHELLQVTNLSTQVIKQQVYSSSQGCHTATGTHVPHGITQCYLPPDRGDIPALTPAEAGTRLSDPGGMQG